MAVVSVVVGAAGLVVGWFVLGTQRVNEKLTEERRVAFAALFGEAHAIGTPAANLTAFNKAVLDAHFLSSSRLHQSRRVICLLDEVGSDEWRARVGALESLARLETQQNSARLRWVHRSDYEPAAVPASLASGAATPGG